MNQSPTLHSIVAYARSGALEHAWQLFREAGFDKVSDDPAVLSVRGRLLKDNGRASSGAVRRDFYRQAAEAYARAGELGGSAYPLINAATLSLLAGQRDESLMLARRVIERADDVDETPYYRAATRAEALLLLGDVAQAESVFADAIAVAPRAYEDQASTLRQFALILDELGEDKAWLDRYRPPRCLHFAGHIGVGNGEIRDGIHRVLSDEHVGFGYGALAAGADIIIAEALLEAGIELNLILPAPKEKFRENSVVRFGADWAARFDAIIKSAHVVRSTGNDPLSPLAIQQSAEVAMGTAVMQADMMATEAIQLLILDRKPGGGRSSGSSGRIAATWAQSGRRQHVLIAPRAKDGAGPQDIAATDLLAAMLRIDLPDATGLADVARVLRAESRLALLPRWTGETVLAAFNSAPAAARAALAVAAALTGTPTWRIAGHFAVVNRLDDPFGGGIHLTGPAVRIPAQIALSTPTGAILVSEDFAAAVHAGSPPGTFRTEYVGNLPGSPNDESPRLYALKH